MKKIMGELMEVEGRFLLLAWGVPLVTLAILAARYSHLRPLPFVIATFTPPPRDLLEAILAHFVQRDPQHPLTFTGDSEAIKVNRHKGFFIWRRAWWLGGNNSTWSQDQLTKRLESEFDALEAYLLVILGTKAAPGPFAGGVDPKSPAHLDLRDIARRYHSDRAGSEAVKGRVQAAISRRVAWTNAIVWRAAAIYEELFDPSPDGSAGFLKVVQMDEILDRRLRAVERMAYNVADATSQTLGKRVWLKTMHGPHGPWKDGFRVRMFEYPRLPNSKLFTNAIGSANIELDPNAPKWQDGKTWRMGAFRQRLEYNVLQLARDGNTRSGLYFPDDQAGQWVVPAGGWDQYLSPDQLTAAQAIDEMFSLDPPDRFEDWWCRCWMFCDHVASALDLEALLLGKRRRDGNDNAFNAIVASKPNYVLIGVVIGLGKAADYNTLMSDDADPYFENKLVNVRDLQVGDHVVFWNSFVYRQIVKGDWRLENAFVMDIDSDPRGSIRVAGRPPSLQLWLQGHGTPKIIYGGYTDEIAGKLRYTMTKLQAEIKDKVQHDPSIITDPGKRKITFSGSPDAQIIYWSPYEDFTAPGAWWVQIPSTVYKDQWQFASVTEAVTAIKKAVGHIDGMPDLHVINDGTQAITISTGGGYNAPPDNDSVYFPIFTPRVADRSGRGDTLESGWYAYLRLRSADVHYRPRHKTVNPIKIDGAIMPGLFYRGASQEAPVVRPKVN